MPILSNGLVVGISSDRARYHATRRNIHVCRDTPHRDLYPLVDIVLAQDRDIPINWKTDYRFSGYTLADQEWLNHFNENDRHCLSAWLDQAHIRYEIEGARRKLIYDDLPETVESHDYSSRLYSRLHQLVSMMPETRYTPAQWRQTLLNLQKKGVRRDELIWSGVLDFLTVAEHRAEASLSRQAILEHIDFYRIRLEVCNELVACATGASQTQYRARYRYISLHGGEDYREWLISLPDYQQSHFGSHYTERNVLLHIRTKQRFDTRGRKLLFIEEIQSDWHQLSVKNIRTQTRAQVPPAPFRKEWVSLGLKLMLLHAVRSGAEGLAWADGRVQAARYRSNLHSVQRIYDKHMVKQLQQLGGHWQGDVTKTEIITRPPYFQIKPLRNSRRLVNRHECVLHPGQTCYRTQTFFSYYAQQVNLQVPVFFVPKGMAEYIAEEGMPLFGNVLEPQTRQVFNSKT